MLLGCAFLLEEEGWLGAELELCHVRAGAGCDREVGEKGSLLESEGDVSGCGCMLE